jgi:hypothetical protein
VIARYMEQACRDQPSRGESSKEAA